MIPLVANVSTQMSTGTAYMANQFALGLQSLCSKVAAFIRSFSFSQPQNTSLLIAQQTTTDLSSTGIGQGQSPKLDQTYGDGEMNAQAIIEALDENDTEGVNEGWAEEVLKEDVLNILATLDAKYVNKFYSILSPENRLSFAVVCAETNVSINLSSVNKLDCITRLMQEKPELINQFTPFLQGFAQANLKHLMLRHNLTRVDQLLTRLQTCKSELHKINVAIEKNSSELEQINKTGVGKNKLSDLFNKSTVLNIKKNQLLKEEHALVKEMQRRNAVIRDIDFEKTTPTQFNIQCKRDESEKMTIHINFKSTFCLKRVSQPAVDKNLKQFDLSLRLTLDASHQVAIEGEGYDQLIGQPSHSAPPIPQQVRLSEVKSLRKNNISLKNKLLTAQFNNVNNKDLDPKRKQWAGWDLRNSVRAEEAFMRFGGICAGIPPCQYFLDGDPRLCLRENNSIVSLEWDLKDMKWDNPYRHH